MDSSADPSAPSKSITRRARHVSLALARDLQALDQQNEGFEAVYVTPGAETRDDPEMERIAKGVIGRALMDIFEQQSARHHRISGLRFIFDRRPEFVAVRNFWCSWAGVHPQQLGLRTRLRIERGALESVRKPV
jgi:hypothetical protein